jgi:hypothetical protein
MKATRCQGTIAKHLLGVICVAASGCASTGMAGTWTDPSARGASLSKVAVVCMTRDVGLRQLAEDAAASQLVGAEAVPSYRALGAVDPNQREVVDAKLRELGFQGVLVMRIARVTRGVNPAMSGGVTFVGSQGGPVFEPPDLQSSTVVRVISDLYSLRDNKLIWSGVSRTFNSTSANTAMAGVSRAVASSLQKERLVL